MPRAIVSPNNRTSEKDLIMARKILLVFGIATMSLTAAACNTVKGVGQDIESVGEAGDDAI
ncbi:hypothetical protein AM2010_1262 [Pelagerythrobacter marensis]|uniref:Entericidin EcnA/B family protein n=1 Tax=Pelagerythrobacter marensis TaxID=543877 RepID=A0A0G3X9M5_9SPHN|nr:hypothetical protein AM2010_1262 [Pelagerythrobacter marensis]